MDASALLKALTTEPQSDAFRAWLLQSRSEGRLLAPHLLRYEVGQFLARATRWDVARREQAHEHALRGIVFADGDGIHAHAPPLTFYDASYLALAKATRSTLVTYDDELSRAAKKAGVPTLSPR